MEKKEVKVCILRAPGTNCDEETKDAFLFFGVKAETLHLHQFIRTKSVFDYDLLVFPGGFSYGDYVRAGAIWAKEIISKIGKGLNKFIEDGKPVLGICNGFQVLVEAGLLPGINLENNFLEAALATNIKAKYECRWVTNNDFLYLKHENSGKCLFTKKIQKGKLLRIPIAHSEGRFLLPKENRKEIITKMYENDQIVFKYALKNGEYANEIYPYNPNGSEMDIAGICNPSGNVFGLMPHPERAFYGWQLPDFTEMKEKKKYGDGYLIFESIIEYLIKLI